MGSTYAPALKDSLKTMSYADFLGVVASGRKNISTAQENVMPAFGDNPNVACYMDDLYIYLRARANDAVGRVRPAKHEDKPDAYTRRKRPAWGPNDRASDRAARDACPCMLEAELEKRKCGV